jgi:hypothetical protein
MRVRQFVINLQTAWALGIEVPNSLQMLTDKLIELVQSHTVCCAAQVRSWHIASH